MSVSPFTTIGVVGAGTMGHGIAHVCALAGHTVQLTDHSADVLARGLATIAKNLAVGVEKGKLSREAADAAIGRVHAVASPSAAAENADLVVEAIPEQLALKQALFAQLDAAAPAHALLASNTSSLSIAAIASAVADPSRVVGAHFFNPVHLMPLLELVRHDAVPDAHINTLRQFAEAIGKTSIVVRDAPGFATSRLGVALGMEAIRMVEQGVASPADIDLAMTLGYRHPVGPLKLTDLVGLDVRLAIGEHLARELGNPAFEPPALMREMVAAGKLGKKTGRGFYDW